MGFYPFAPLVPAGSLLATALAGQTIPGALTTTGLLTGAGVVGSGVTAISAGGNLFAATGNLDVQTAGKGLAVAEGSNAKQGTASLTAGTVTVANTAVTANSRIFLTGQLLGGTAGGLNVTSRTAGTSFVVTSTNAADTSTFAYEIIEPG